MLVKGRIGGRQTFQHGLFPWLAEKLGPLSERYKRLVQVLEIVCVEERLPGPGAGGRGRPQQYPGELPAHGAGAA